MEIKIYLKSFLSFSITLIFLLLLTTILYYFDLINYNTTKYFKIVTIIISSFISGYIRGYNSINKGYINGLKLSGLIILILFLFSLIVKEFDLFDIIYYIIILLTTTFGSMVGISKKQA